MTLVQSWIDSLRLLKPKNLQLFTMVTLKSIVEAYKLMFRFFWWVVPALILFSVLLSLVGPFTFPNYYGPLEALRDYNLYWFYFHMRELSYVLYGLLFLAVCFITRPSVMQKNWSYLRTQYRKIILYWLFIIAIFNVSALVVWYIFLVLFFLDSEGGPKNFLLSMWYALKMIIFNFPLILAIGIILRFPMWFLNLLYYHYYGNIIIIPTVIYNIIGVLLLPIGICTYANIYIKKLHDQFDLYFKPTQ